MLLGLKRQLNNSAWIPLTFCNLKNNFRNDFSLKCLEIKNFHFYFFFHLETAQFAFWDISRYSRNESLVIINSYKSAELWQGSGIKCLRYISRIFYKIEYLCYEFRVVLRMSVPSWNFQQLSEYTGAFSLW